jgi:Ethanolamine utilization protein EutJ (predicted chaperonin)
MIFWDKSWREATWQQLDLPWDVIIIGGGITGAGCVKRSSQIRTADFIGGGKRFCLWHIQPVF